MSFDPNDIIGPSGQGAQNWITSNQPLNYTIRFENDPNKASAPAQVVKITQKLDPDLDLRTFRNVYHQVGGIDRSFKVAADYDLCLKLSENTEIFHLREPLYLYRNHQDNISHTKQFEQISFSYRAISNALDRRGLTNQFALQVKVNPQFTLIPKPKPS